MLPSTSKHFGGEAAIRVEFRPDNKSYVFARSSLVENFAYLSTALEGDDRRPVSSEGTAGRVVLELHVSSRAFARVYKYALQPESYALDRTTTAKLEDESIGDLLAALLAADFLQFNNFESFETHIAERLAIQLLKSRRYVEHCHILLVMPETQHPAFKSKLIWWVIVASGVRPLLQEHMLHADHAKLIDRHDAPGPGHRNPAEWDAILVHCRSLRDEIPTYGFGVASRISGTLAAGRQEHETSGNKGAIVYYDPLLDFMSWNARESFTMLPVRTRFIV
jgi:hypothetical protein